MFLVLQTVKLHESAQVTLAAPRPSSLILSKAWIEFSSWWSGHLQYLHGYPVEVVRGATNPNDLALDPLPHHLLQPHPGGSQVLQVTDLLINY